LNEFNHKLFVIDKECGPTSFDIVKALRSAARVEKVGHAGTLDPLAKGILLLITGKATRAASYFMDLKKTYRFDVCLGIATTTLDGEGEVVETAPCPDFPPGEIAAAAVRLTGSYEQTPPLFSAVKQNGKRLYELARQGETPDIKKRLVTVYRFDIVGISLPVVRCRIECSRGTYVRSVARDFGALLGIPAHVSMLTRESVGRFTLDGAFPSGKLCEGDLSGLTGIELESALDFLPAVVIREQSIAPLLNGIAPGPDDVVGRTGSIVPDKPVRILDERGVLFAVGQKEAEQGMETEAIVDSYRLFVDRAV
jgi:tRNA pseudouridine55 synthase